MLQKPSWYIFLTDDKLPFIRGIGECSIIPGLSPETEESVDRKIDEICRIINRHDLDVLPGLQDYPSIAFGLETAHLDLKNGGKREFFPSAFTEGRSCIQINGLIWMGTIENMTGQIEEKLKQGYGCLKLKIGSLRAEDELDLLKSLRKRFSARELELRVDANGAFPVGNALEILKKLADMEVHSVEQPIKQGQPEEMARLCSVSPVPIALDEELAGRKSLEEKRALVTLIRPQYLILKPGLLGGFQQALEYISIAKQESTGWWITSALESNIGLNAIAQWTFTLGNPLAQGLGTGKLYRQNVSCPLMLLGDRLFYEAGKEWDLSYIES